MTPTQRAAMEQALEALEQLGKVMVHYPIATEAATALRTALAEPAEQEPDSARYALAMLVDPEKLEPWQLSLYEKAMVAPQPSKPAEQQAAQPMDADVARFIIAHLCNTFPELAHCHPALEPAKREPDSERSAFEVWQRGYFGPLTTKAELRVMWDAWQARAMLAAHGTTKEGA